MRALALAVALMALPTLAEAPSPELCADPSYRARGGSGCDPKPTDAPVREIIKAGQPAPQNGCFLNDSACTATGKEMAALRAENANLKTSLGDAPGPLLVVAALMLGLVGGAAAASLVLSR